MSLDRRSLMQAALGALAAGKLGLASLIDQTPAPPEKVRPAEWPPMPAGNGQLALFRTGDRLAEGDLCILDYETLEDGCLARVRAFNHADDSGLPLCLIALQAPNRHGYLWCLVSGQNSMCVRPSEGGR